METLEFVRKVTRFALTFVVLCCTSMMQSAAQSSTTSQVSGVVKDASGAALAGAQVEITNTDTNAVRTAQTDGTGSYAFPSLPIGPYRLKVGMTGFQTYVQSGIILEVGVNPTVNVSMALGAVTQQVEVQADAAMVETQSNAVGQVITPEQVVDLPLNGRQATQLIALSGAAVTSPSTLTPTLDFPTAVAFSVAGSQPNATNYFLDGSLNMDYRLNTGLPLPFPDALQEFSVQMSAIPANLGQRPGGIVTGATKAGTNQFHGDIFEFLRNGVLDADSTTYAPTPTGVAPRGAQDNLRRNQFGGVIGGPIRKDKLFFFAGYQRTSNRSAGALLTTTVPTAAMLAGDFRAFLAPPCQPTATTIVLNSSYTTSPGSQVLRPELLKTPAALIGAKVAALMPAAINACGTANYQTYTSNTEHQAIGRVDWQRTSNDTIFGRYFMDHYYVLPYYKPGNIFTASTPGLGAFLQNVGIGDTRVITTHLISTVRVSLLRKSEQRLGVSGIPTLCDLGETGYCPASNYLHVGTLNAPGFLGYNMENEFGVTEGISWVRGKHQMDFGGTYTRIQMNNDGLFQVNPNPTFAASGPTSYTGDYWSDLLTGNVDGYGQGNGQLGRDGQQLPSLFFSDAWKVTSRLQFNVGLRWDPFFPQHNKYGQAEDFSLDGYKAGKVSSKYVNAPPGVTFPGDPGFNGKSDTNNSLADFAPRFGFIWDPKGNGKQTIRSSYGIFYDTSILWNTMHIVLNPPWGETLSFTPLPVSASPTGSAGLANPFYGQTGGNPFPTPLNPLSNFAFPQGGTWVFENQSNKPAYVQQWNLAYQRQISRDWLASASYIGNKTTHMWLGTNQNPSVFLSQYGTTLPCTLQYAGQSYTFNPCNASSTHTATVNGVTVNNENARRALVLLNPAANAGPLFSGGLITSFAQGNAAYNGLLLSLQHRLSHGFSVSTNFTWSHCLDDGEVGQDITNAFQNPNDRKADWGNCATNESRIYNLSTVAETPRLSNHMVDVLLGHWSASGIFTAHTGQYVTPLEGSDVSLTGVGADHMNLVGNPFVAGPVAANPTCVAPTVVKTVAHWYNPCGYASIAPGTYGNAKRNSLLMPGNWNLDAAVWRSFPLPEKVVMDFRFEAFNALNHTEIGNPSGTIGNGVNPGIITTSAPGTNSRIMQAALKFTF